MCERTSSHDAGRGRRTPVCGRVDQIGEDGQKIRHFVFATDDTGFLSTLSSSAHYWWAIARSATLKGDLSYAPSDVFETLPLPELTSETRELGDRLDTFRRELMLARRKYSEVL